jgi:predicted GNAT family acetyltransferase
LAHAVFGYGGGRKGVALEGGEMNVEVRNNPAKQRYELWVDGQRVGHANYRLGNGRIALVHTKVYEPHESLGLGTQLARVALDDARARGLMVMPFCPFIADFIEHHLDEYGDLVAPEMLTGERP